MGSKKKIVVFFIIMALMINFLTIFSITAFAHPAILNVSYDGCFGDKYNDSEIEKWYALNNASNVCYHLSHETTEIKYSFAEYAIDSPNDTWVSLIQRTSSNELSDEEANIIADDIKSSYADSMEKWNNVYFYTYDSEGNIIKNRIISVRKAAAGDMPNLIIYPAINISGIASTWGTDNYTEVQNGNTPHRHYDNWSMNMNIEFFYEHYSIGDENDDGDDRYYGQETTQIVKERTGAHELGHVLGLRDLDKDALCGSTVTDEWHHLEVLMGYGEPLYNRCSDITYKDIAGVAITRGFHTDADHSWLGWGEQYDGTFKLICSICNAVKYVTNSSDYSYLEGQSCYKDHELLDGNMMPVASYGNKDYYKCKYCRYVAPFDAIVQQNYSNNKIYHSGTYHTVENLVQGLQYTIYEYHSYGHLFLPNNKSTHWNCCACGDKFTQAHVIAQGSVGGGNLDKYCKYCGAYLGIGPGTLDGVYTDYPHTENGSYILPNGIIVLAPEDEEAYLNGTLEFRTGEIM